MSNLTTYTKTISSNYTNENNVNIILQKNSIRSILKNSSNIEIQKMQKALNFAVLIIANTYTNAKFNNPLTKSENHLLTTCSTFIINNYPELNIKEIDLAFQLAASKKIDVNLNIFGGKFNIGLLGNVLTSYKIFRKKVIYEQHKKTYLPKAPQIDQILIKNDEAAQSIIKKFFGLKSLFLEGETIPITDVQFYWYKTLDAYNLINVGDSVKKILWDNSKKYVDSNLKQQVSSNISAAQKQSIKHIIKNISQGNINSTIYAKYVNRYKIELMYYCICQDK